MAKWRVDRMFGNMSDVDALALDELPTNVKINDVESKYPVYTLWKQFMAGDVHMNINYPGGFEQFKKDAMAEREMMLRGE